MVKNNILQCKMIGHLILTRLDSFSLVFLCRKLFPLVLLPVWSYEIIKFYYGYDDFLEIVFLFISVKF